MDNGAALLPSEHTVKEKRKKKTEIITAVGKKKKKKKEIKEKQSREEHTGDVQQNIERDLSKQGRPLSPEGDELLPPPGAPGLGGSLSRPGAELDTCREPGLQGKKAAARQERTSFLGKKNQPNKHKSPLVRHP